MISTSNYALATGQTLELAENLEAIRVALTAGYNAVLSVAEGSAFTWQGFHDASGADPTPVDGGFWAVTVTGTVDGQVANAGDVFISDGTNFQVIHQAVIEGGLLAANNLSDVGSVATSQSNLQLGTNDSPTFAGLTINSAAPNLDFYEFDGASDEKRWGFSANNGDLTLRSLDDAYTTERALLTGIRGTGNAISEVRYGNSTDLPAHTMFGSTRVEGTAPVLYFDETDQGADEKASYIGPNGGAFVLQFLNDAESLAKDVLRVWRSGYAATSMIYGNATDNPDHILYGDIGIGATPDEKLHIAGTSVDTWALVEATSNANIDAGFRAETYPNDGTEYISMFARNDDGTQHIESSDQLFITPGGKLTIDQNNNARGLDIDSDATTEHAIHAAAPTSEYITRLVNEHGSNPSGLRLTYNNTSPNGTGNLFLYLEDNSAQRGSWRSNGGIANYQANDVNLSDERTKDIIGRAPLMWDEIQALHVDAFRYKDQNGQGKIHFSPTAQTAMAANPEWVDAGGWGEDDNHWSIYEHDVKYAMLGVIQELQRKVTHLEYMTGFHTGVLH